MSSLATPITLAGMMCAALSAGAVARADGGPAETTPSAVSPKRAEGEKPTEGANEDQDLERIPDLTPQPGAAESKAPRASAANERIYLENALIPSAARGDLIVPAPPPGVPAVEERLLLDGRKTFGLADRLDLTLSDRLNLRVASGLPFPDHEDVVAEFREAFLSFEVVDGLYLDLGRINLKSGAALGYSPTDYFKTRAVVEPISADPSVLREDRLGTFMLEAQYLGRGFSLTVALAPALANPGAIPNDTTLPSFDLSLDRTNDHPRLLAKGSVDLGGDVSPELLFYREGDLNEFGANLTRSLGQSVVAYVEWSGGERSSLIDEALRYGRETGTLPSGAPSFLPDNTHVSFENDLSVGASYTTTSKVTFNLEYHFHQAGFSREDWDNWFGAGAGHGASSPEAGELWYIRSYALDMQEPLARQGAFLRVDWVDALVTDLEITGFVNTDLYDGSSLVQAEADYYLSGAWTVGALVQGNLGSRHSDFGSLPEAASFLVKLARYF
jgi:hypothetical protein